MLGGGFYATRLYHDLRQVNGYVYNVGVSLDAGEDASDVLGELRLRSRQGVEGARADCSRSGADAD